MVYNPFSILYCFHDKKMSDYWFESGTPNFLVKLLREQQDLVEKMSSLNFDYIGSDHLAPLEPDAISPSTLLLQTGYFTIVGYDKEKQEYRVGYPNNEVREALRSHLVLALTAKLDTQTVNSVARRIRNALYAANFELFVKELQISFSHITYRQYASQKSHDGEPNEGFYHALPQLLFMIADLKPEVEVATSQGLIDMVLSTPKNIIVFELKYNKSAQKGINQIKTKRYAEKYHGQEKPVLLVGLSFIYKEKKLSLEYASETSIL